MRGSLESGQTWRRDEHRHRGSEPDSYGAAAHLNPEAFGTMFEKYDLPALSNRFIQKELYVDKP